MRSFAVGDRVARIAIRAYKHLCDLCSVGAAWDGALVRRAGDSSDTAAVGSGRTFSQRGGLECERLSRGNNSGSDGGWTDLHGLTRSFDGVPDGDADGIGGSPVDTVDEIGNQGAGTRSGQFEYSAGGIPLCLAEKTASGIDLAGYVCGAARRRGRAVAGV